uniref:L-xylulose reductase-like n=1 Tax=Styela clava TaxID=7725 RepID=UPI00193A4194|nr:L-xylulose reductase-like [Styela clava]
MEISFGDKRALVTGAGKGIGRDLAKRLVECGAETYALSRTKSDLESLKKECPAIHTIQCDLANWDETDRAVKSCGDIDLLVNNAAVAELESFLEITKDCIDKHFDINVKAMIHVSQIVAKGMVARGTGGSIVNVSSQASKAALWNHTVYSVSKAAVDQLTAMMGVELGPYKIRVNAVLPTVTNTAMALVGWSDPAKADPMKARIPLRKFAEVEDVTNVILYLLSDKAAMINATCIPVDGGYLAT